MAGGDSFVTTSSNSGTAADLGAPPVPGLSSRKKGRKKKKEHPDLVPFFQVSETGTVADLNQPPQVGVDDKRHRYKGGKSPYKTSRVPIKKNGSKVKKNPDSLAGTDNKFLKQDDYTLSDADRSLKKGDNLGDYKSQGVQTKMGKSGEITSGDIGLTARNNPFLKQNDYALSAPKKSDTSKRQFVETLHYIHELEEDEPLDNEEMEAENLSDEMKDSISTETDDSLSVNTLLDDEDPNMDVDDPDFNAEDAEELLDQMDTEEEGGGEEEDDAPPKVFMKNVMRYRVDHRKKLPRDPNRLNLARPHIIQLKITERINELVEEKEGGEETKNDREEPERKTDETPKEILARLSFNNGAYVLSTTVTTGNENRDYVFEGNRTRMIAILIVLGASVRERPGTPQDAVNLSAKQTEPLEVVINYDRLLTFGQAYAQQVMAR